jgi:hypothetical protein
LFSNKRKCVSFPPYTIVFCYCSFCLWACRCLVPIGWSDITTKLLLFLFSTPTTCQEKLMYNIKGRVSIPTSCCSCCCSLTFFLLLLFFFDWKIWVISLIYHSTTLLVSQHFGLFFLGHFVGPTIMSRYIRPSISL